MAGVKCRATCVAKKILSIELNFRGVVEFEGGGAVSVENLPPRQTMQSPPQVCSWKESPSLHNINLIQPCTLHKYCSRKNCPFCSYFYSLRQFLLENAKSTSVDQCDDHIVHVPVDKCWSGIESKHTWLFNDAKVTPVAPMHLSQLGKIMKPSTMCARVKVWMCCQHSGKGITLASFLWMLSNRVGNVFLTEILCFSNANIHDAPVVIAKCQEAKELWNVCVHFIHSLFVARKILKPSGFCSHIRDAVAAAACTCGQRPSSHGAAVKFWSLVLSSSKGSKTYLSTLAPRPLLSQNCGKQRQILGGVMLYANLAEGRAYHSQIATSATPICSCTLLARFGNSDSYLLAAHLARN